MSNYFTNDLYLRPLPYLDVKWLRAELNTSLRSAEDTAVLWNHLIQDCELVSSPAAPVLNVHGNYSYLGDDGKHYCGANKLECACCQPNFCGPLTACNCDGCRPLDSDSAIKKLTTVGQQNNSTPGTEIIFDTWHWSQPPNTQAKKDCMRALINELHEQALRAAGNCLSAQHIRQHLFIYERYFVALTRMRQQIATDNHLIKAEPKPYAVFGNAGNANNNSNVAGNRSGYNSATLNRGMLGGSSNLPAHIIRSATDATPTNTNSPIREAVSNDHPTFGLARVGTRAALNFTFAFLRRAWRSGEDTELCSELLCEALESLQELPEATLFDAMEISPLWIEVLERSIKFLRIVVLGDPMGGRCVAPLADRHTALCLLLELGAQKGTLAATLESVVLLLLLWDIERGTNDNREIQTKTGAPLLPILQRYERICKDNQLAMNYTPNSASTISATETFLRFLMLPNHSNAIIDLKKAAVVIMSHLDRLAKPHMPNYIMSVSRNYIFPYNASPKMKATPSEVPLMAGNGTNPHQEQHEQRIYALGWHSLTKQQYGFTLEPMSLNNTSSVLGHYAAPTLNVSFQVKQIACSEDMVVYLTFDGKLYNWRFLKPESEPVQVEDITDIYMTSIATNCEGKHYLATDNFGNAYAWGTSEGGCLGLVDTMSRESPTKILGLERCVKSVHCGAAYSAAITYSGYLYTWGRGTYGRLGHGNSDDKIIPTQVLAMSDHEVVDVALGSGDAHTICLTSEGSVYSWGDGDYGKLGHGSCNSSLVPVLIETLPRIQRVFAGPQFSLALSVEGCIYTWGKGGCLGYESCENNVSGSSVPKLISALKHKQIVDIAVGVSHCIALSDNGEVFGWGRNDYQQICPSTICAEPLLRTPICVTHTSVIACGIACTASNSIIWSQSTLQGLPTKVPFVIDLSEQTFRLLDQLLSIVCGNNQDNNNQRQTPNQESECIAVSCLNLLRLQLVALKANNVEAHSVGLASGSRLLGNLKTRVLSLAGGTNVLKTIQMAAQSALQDGWSVLLPTAAERAQTLTSLLPSEPGNASSGHRFMTDLLVSSLMAEGGLETALQHAIRQETNECGDNNGHNLPLLHLITRLLSNNAALTQSKLTQQLLYGMRSGLGAYSKHDDPDANNDFRGFNADRSSPSLCLLHRFQRLLLSHIHQAKNEDTSGAETLLQQYMQSIVPLCVATLQKAHELSLKAKYNVSDIMKMDISDALLYELLIGLILLKRDRPQCLSKFNWSKLFVPLLHALDSFNRVICDSELQDGDDMGWPGIICRAGIKGNTGSGNGHQTENEIHYIRKADFDNHVLDGGRWIIVNGFVCDISGYRSEIGSLNDLLEFGIGKDITTELSSPALRGTLEYLLQHHKVGKYANSNVDDKHSISQGKMLTHFNSECALAYILGLVANLLVAGSPLQMPELQCKNINKSTMLSGGLLLLQPSNPFDEEKGEARSSNSTAGNTPTEQPMLNLPHYTCSPSQAQLTLQQRIDAFINGLAEARLSEPLVATWVLLTEGYLKEYNLTWHQHHQVEPSVQELERLLTAILIRHQSLGGVIVNYLEMYQTEVNSTGNCRNNQPLPKQITEIIRLVNQTKWSVVRTRQQLNRSYKEVCAPIIERSRFLLYEVRPAISAQQQALRQLPLLHRMPRFKHLVRKFIVEMRASKKQLACAKPEDILNVTIQSQHVALLKSQNQSQELDTPQQDQTSEMSPEGTEITDQTSSFNGQNLVPTVLMPQQSNEDLLDGSDNADRKVNSTSNEQQELKNQANELIYEDKKPEDSEESVTRMCSESFKKIGEKVFFPGELNTALMHDIVDFVLQDSCDVETVRRAMYCQMQRYKTRLSGLEMFQSLLEVQGLHDAAQYSLLNGYLGLHLKYNTSGNGVGSGSGNGSGNASGVKQYTTHVLQNLNMITAYQKANLLLAQSRIIEWAVSEVKRLVNQEQQQLKSKYNVSVGGADNNGGDGVSNIGVGKDNSNLGTYVLLKKLPRARFLLSVFGMLAKELTANELSLLINSGLLGTVLGLMAQTGGEFKSIKHTYDTTVVYEDTILKQKSNKANLTGPDLAKLMKIGTRIVRGADWKWGDQDGNPPGEGRIISEVGEDGWVRVEWYTGATNSYRMGKEGQYDLQLADSTLNIVSPAESEKESILCEAHPTAESHPTKLLRYCATKLLQIIAVGCGIHSELMDKHAVRGLASMFRAILDTRSTLANLSNCMSWVTLGFIKAISSESRLLARYLSSPAWIDFYIEIVEQPTSREQDIYRKIHCLRLLQSILVYWSADEMNNIQRTTALVRQLFATLGKITLYCRNDASLALLNGRPRVILSASHSGTVAEEIITLLRKLHSVPHWNAIINSFLAQKLCVGVELLGEEDVLGRQLQIPNQQVADSEYVYVMGALNTIGGYDIRPRIGLNCIYDNNPMTISGFTTRGRCLLVHNNLANLGNYCKVTLATVLQCADYSTFNLPRLPMNEMLLNAWSVLLYGAVAFEPQKNSSATTVAVSGEALDLNLLRTQQLQLAVLNTNCVLYRYQTSLRKVLRQRVPGACHVYNSEESSSDDEHQKHQNQEQQQQVNNEIENNDAATKDFNIDSIDTEQTNEGSNQRPPANEVELLIQCILHRATQPSPVKACYSYSDLVVSALNCVESLAYQSYADKSQSKASSSEMVTSKTATQAQPTMIHGVPLYNFSAMLGDTNTVASIANTTTDAKQTSSDEKPTETQLIDQIMEMGFTRKFVEFAVKQLSMHSEVIPTPEQVVQWILEHPDVCASSIDSTAEYHDSYLLSSGACAAINSPTVAANKVSSTEKALSEDTGSGSMERHGTKTSGSTSHDPEADSDNESISSANSSDTVEGSSVHDQMPVKFETRKDFQTADQYALYIRGLVCPGMIVRCCRDFEEIKKGDIGTVLIVDTEGLHDLNVQVDWQNHGNTYWVCFVHIELVEMPRDKIPMHRPPHPVKGSRVRMRASSRFNWAQHLRVGRSIGLVTSVKGKDIIVDFPELPNWRGSVNDVELVCVSYQRAVQPSSQQPSTNDLINDWSRCIRSLSVSSNASTAKHLLDNTTNVWQSTSSGQGKHWIRLEMHDNILVHNLTMQVSPEDHSHMPSLVEVRVGECVDSLKEYTWLAIKPNSTNFVLMHDVRHYFPWIEIVIKQCHNNGIQCKVHGIQIIGRRKQTDIDYLLMNASFLANEFNNSANEEQSEYISGATASSVSTGSTTGADVRQIQQELPCTVMVWGLNDKEQLGGLKGSKVKVPTFSQTISRLRPIHIAGGSKSLFIVSQDGKVYACGEGTNGRLGLGVSHNVSVPHQVPVLHQYVVKKVAVHSGGKHALALTLDGKVFSWGEGEDGKLGHGNRLTLDKPKLIEALRPKKVRDIACGSSHSAAITSAGELFTWGLGEYGRLGHGDNSTQLKPKVVTTLLGKRVIQVACGSRDAQTLALTEDGTVFSWGDGDFGKLGRGGSEGSAIPHEIERLTGIGVIQIECGAQFSLALTRSGEVWTWGKGDYYRLGHGGDQHVRKPQPIQGLRGRRVIHVAVGALHCLAVTDTGQVFAWGDNDHGQQGSGNTFVNKKPALVIGLDLVFVNRVACGSSHSIAWGLPNASVDDEKKGPVPFTTTRDPLGGNSLGIYDADSQCSLGMPTTTAMGSGGPTTSTGASVSTGGVGLSESLLALETLPARQQALNYILRAMNILQARQLIIASLTSHSKVNYNEKQLHDIDSEHGNFRDLTLVSNITIPGAGNQTGGSGNITIGATNAFQANTNEIIAQGGGEGPADASDPALHEVNPDNLTDAGGVLPTTSAVPISAFQSLTGSMSLSASLSSNAMPHKQSKMSVSAMSVMAATMNNQEEMMEQLCLSGLDDFTSLLGESEAKSLVELLKLSVCGRTGPPSTAQTIAETLILLGENSSNIGAMLLETCITELEDLCTSRYCLGKTPKPIMQESSHPYVDNVNITGHVKIPGAEMLRLEFDSQCSTEKRNDPLVIMDGSSRVIAMRSGREFAHWAPELRIPGEEVRWKFSSDSSVNGWGWRFWVHAIMPASTLNENGSDRAVLSQPSMALVMALLDERLGPHNSSVLLRLAAALSTCSQLSALTTNQRIWALKKLHAVLLLPHAPKPFDPALNPIILPLLMELLRQYEYEEPQVRGGIHLMHSEYFKSLAALACDMQLDNDLPSGDVHKWAWFKRYCIAVRVAQSLINRTELPKQFCMEVRKKIAEMLPTSIPNGHSPVPGTSLMNSTTSLSSSTTSNLTPPPANTLSSTSAAVSSVNALTPNWSCLIQYIDSVMSLSAQENTSAGTVPTSTAGSGNAQALNEQLLCLHEDHSLFKAAHDAQLLQWLNRRPDDWALSWGGASTIYGWGHNHRGQLGGLEGSRIKSPTPCEALSLLRPVQLAGGEQTLFAVTPDGKLFATGYGSGGRLGVGGTDSWAIPTLVSSLQHVFIKKVAVNSGGKHCLALTTEGEVYSWGEGEDGKLGHGNRMSYDRPKLIEDLEGLGVIDIACGSAHSAAITAAGDVYTWGKGRYGRLGHGDSEDQLRPKLVDALLCYRVVDIACGSGDAQTLCITDDDNVWSWGDGDYGKLGRGGSDGCKVPYKIESLSGLGVIKVECGSQFSVALTKSGAVYTWGKGDFHRLGHGSVDHVRRPKKVAALQGKKIISIATGSLHCVACTDTGEVYTWGDNDEGQLGDGTVTAIQRPRLVTALQGKHIVKVTCGSAHTLALSTSQLAERLRPLPNPPLEYDLVRDLPPEALHARLILLHHFSELLCPCLAMLPISGNLSLGALKEVLVYNIKEAAFRKVIQTTMVRDKQHGPVIELNRIQVKRSRNKCSNGLAGVDGMKSVFGQMVQKLPLLTQEALSLPHRVWKVKFVGESVDDCGGGYSESIAEMCDELQNGSVPLLISTPNGRGEAGANRDCFLLDPNLNSVLQMNMFRFLGVLMGIAVRTGSPLSLNLAEPVWRQLTGEQLRPSDLTEVDRDYVAGLLCIKNMEDDPKVFNTLEFPFTTHSAKGHEVPLSTRYTRITPTNRSEYVRLALHFRLHEFDEQVKAVRDGMSKVIPVPLLSLFSAAELQAMVCGSPDIPLGLLKSVATYKGFDPHSPLVSWFWEVMEEFTNQERSLFLRFVWGRTRLPRTIADFRGRDFVLQVLEKNPADLFLPESYTCFFLLKMPRYSSKAVLLEKLKYAIHFCKSIDTDEYARVAMGEPTEITGSEDNSDLESVTSHDA